MDKVDEKSAGPVKDLSTVCSGKVNVGDYEIQCAVLNNEKRVFWQREIVGLLTGASKGSLARYFEAKNLQKYVPEKFSGSNWDQNIIRFNHKGRMANGFEAEDLIDICYMYLNARKDDALTPNQYHLAEKADIIVKAFAKTGVIAVIDEATGYQQIRKRDALQAILDRFLRKEFAAWAKTFPDEFYQQIFRLKGWNYDPQSVKRPSVIGKYTNDIVYSRLAPGVLEELQKRNPVTGNGHRKGRHHQLLTEDVGHPALAQHLYAVLALMRASNSWDSFYRKLNKAFPKENEQLFLEDAFEDDI